MISIPDKLETLCKREGDRTTVGVYRCDERKAMIVDRILATSTKRRVFPMVILDQLLFVGDMMELMLAMALTTA